MILFKIKQYKVAQKLLEVARIEKSFSKRQKLLKSCRAEHNLFKPGGAKRIVRELLLLRPRSPDNEKVHLRCKFDDN